MSGVTEDAGGEDEPLWEEHRDRLREWERGDDPVLRAIARAARDRRQS